MVISTSHHKKGIKLSLLSGGWWTHPSISTHHWWIRSYRWSSTVHIHVMLCFRPDLLYLSHTNTQEHLAFVFKVKDTISIHPHVKWLWLALMETCHLGNKNTNVQGFFQLNAMMQTKYCWVIIDFERVKKTNQRLHGSQIRSLPAANYHRTCATFTIDDKQARWLTPSTDFVFKTRFNFSFLNVVWWDL